MGYCSLAYSALASFRMGMSGSARFVRLGASLEERDEERKSPVQLEFPSVAADRVPRFA
jgi:hypothetical protein